VSAPGPPTTRSVVTWFIGFATSLLGDQIFYVALTWAAAVQVTNPRTVGLILVANAVARAVVLLVGGVLVDRLGPKRLVVGSDAARTLVMILTAAWLVTRAPDVGMLVALAVVFGLVDGLFLPAVGAMPVYLAPKSAMTRLQAPKTIVTRGAVFAGAPLGAWIILTGSVRLAFVLNGVLFGVSVVALLMTRVLPRGRSNDRPPGVDAPELAVPTAAPAAVSRWWQDWRRELHDGLRVIAADPTLRTVVILVAVLDFGFAGPITVGVPLPGRHRRGRRASDRHAGLQRQSPDRVHAVRRRAHPRSG
jgi:MFS family permease